jgi:hypothetical protein
MRELVDEDFPCAFRHEELAILSDAQPTRDPVLPQNGTKTIRRRSLETSTDEDDAEHAVITGHSAQKVGQWPSLPRSLTATTLKLSSPRRSIQRAGGAEGSSGSPSPLRNSALAPSSSALN